MAAIAAHADHHGGDQQSHPRQSIMEMFSEGRCLKIAAPMVRFSKLPFRHVVRSYGCDIVYTPMIMAESFVASQKARDVEFTMNAQDNPCVVQFAAHDAKEFADAAEMVARHVSAVDLNCGCPQRWAMQEGVGAALLKKPELVRDMVHQARERAGIPISIKIRISRDLRETVELVKLAEQVGVSWITLHGRTASNKPSDPVDYEAIRFIKQEATVPLVANGDVKRLEDVEMIRTRTGADGAMAARGLLTNPAMFAGFERTPDECINDYVYAATRLGSRFEVFHKTLEWMTCEVLNKSDRILLNACISVPAVIDMLRARGLSLQPSNRLLPLA